LDDDNSIAIDIPVSLDYARIIVNFDQMIPGGPDNTPAAFVWISRMLDLLQRWRTHPWRMIIMCHG